MPNPYRSDHLWVNVVAIFLGAVQFVFLPFFGNINGTAKQFVAIFFVLIAISPFLKSFKRLHLPSSTPLFALFFLWSTFSCWQAFHKYDALAALACLGAALLILFCSYNLAFKFPAFRLKIIDTLLFTGTVASVLGLYQYTHFRFFGISQNYYHIKGMLIPYLLPPMANMRVQGIYGHANFFALFLVVCLLAFCCRYVHFREPFISPFWSKLRFVPVLLVGLTFFLTQSRGGMISLFFAFCLLAYIIVKGRYPFAGRGQKRELVFFGVTLLFSFLIFKLLSNPDFFSAMVTSEVGSGAVSSPQLVRTETFSSHNIESRIVHYLTSWLIFLDHPWFGVGLDNLKSFLAVYQVKALGLLHFEYEAMEYTRWSHNEYLQILAEGGIVPFILVIFSIFWLSYSFLKKLFSEKNNDPLFVYSHILLIPFVFQAALSWPLRHPSLLALFMVLLGMSLSYYSGREYSVSAGAQRIFIALTIVALFVTGLLVKQEYMTRKTWAVIYKSEQPEQFVEDFELLVYNPYNEYFVLKNMLPKLIARAVREADDILARRLLPHAERLVEIEGSYWEWYYLSRLYFITGREREARQAIRTAIDLRPNYEPSWVWQHHMNMVSVAKATNVPLKEVLRQAREGWEELNGRNSIPKRKQAL